MTGKMKKAVTFVLIGAAVLLGGCSNVKSEAITSSNHEKVMTDVAQSKLTDEEKKHFLAASMRSALGNYSTDGKTVAQVIDEQKKYQDEQDAQAAAAHEAQLKAEAKTAALVSEMQHALSVQPISKRFVDSDYMEGRYDKEEYITFQIHNTGKKTIQGLKGLVRFNSSFGDKVIQLLLTEGGVGGEAIKILPGHIYTTEDGWKVNQFEESWNTFRATAMSGMKTTWIPEQIIFGDGSTLKATEESSSSS